MTETVTTPPSGAPAFPSNRTCPYHLPDQYNELRDREGSLQQVTLYDGRQAWLVTRYDTARKLLSDPGSRPTGRTTPSPRPPSA